MDFRVNIYQLHEQLSRKKHFQQVYHKRIGIACVVEQYAARRNCGLFYNAFSSVCRTYSVDSGMIDGYE
jgi:hypothetical protein